VEDITQEEQTISKDFLKIFQKSCIIVTISQAVGIGKIVL